jgi:hypothetical protein
MRYLVKILPIFLMAVNSYAVEPLDLSSVLKVRNGLRAILNLPLAPRGEICPLGGKVHPFVHLSVV